jgi:hypothetical protein
MLGTAGPPGKTAMRGERRDRLGSTLAAAAAAGLGGAYVAQTASPLRLSGDSIEYLRIARSLATGHGIPPHAGFPPGLPALYALLDAAGVGTASAFVAVNCIFLAVALGCSLFLYRRVFELTPPVSLVLGVLVLLSYVVLKHTVVALSDVPFLGVAYAALAAMTVAYAERTRRRWVALVAAAFAVAVAIALRKAGIALVPAWISTLIAVARNELPLREWVAQHRARATATAVVAFAAIAAAAFTIAGSRYLGSATGLYRNAGATRTASFVVDHIRNWGEITANTPRTHVPGSLDVLLVPLGIVAIAVLVGGLWRVRRPFGPVHVFTVAYLVLVFTWPYDDARFWLPLVPLAPAYAWTALRPLAHRRAAAWTLGVYLACFAGLGLAAIALTTRISYSGRAFSSRYGEGGLQGSLRPTYRVAFGVAQPGDRAHVNATALVLLRHYEPLARPKHRAHRRR